MNPRPNRSTFWLGAAIACGCLLGILLLVETLFTYHFVSHRLIDEEAEREANRTIGTLIESARSSGITDFDRFGPLLEKEWTREPRRIAWLRLSSNGGKLLAVAGDPAGQPLPSFDQVQRKANRREALVARQVSAAGPVFIVASRMRPPRSRPPGGGERTAIPPFTPGTSGPPPGAILEVGIYLDRVSLAFGPLEHNLIIGSLASLALLASMVLIALLLRRYSRATELEQQLQLAEVVQRDLLPRPGLYSALQSPFAAVSLPAATVGGDFHDVLPGPGERLSIVLGDVSGKGISAALLMGVIHGAIRSTDWMTSVSSHEAATSALNRLLCEKTAHERFASLFWCCFEPRDNTLRYINAGHLPPLLVRAARTPSKVEKLDAGGGPVLGLLPAAQFQASTVTVQPGDLLVIYSDGIVEATDENDVEFGEDRVAQCVAAAVRETPDHIVQTLLAKIQRFLGPLKPHDDQTVLVVRLIPLEQEVPGRANFDQWAKSVGPLQCRNR